MTSSRYHPYPSFIYNNQIQDQSEPQTSTYSYGNQIIPNQTNFNNFGLTQTYENFSSNIAFGPRNTWRPPHQNSPFGMPTQINRWWAPYPMFTPRPPMIQEETINHQHLSASLTNSDSSSEFLHSMARSTEVGDGAASNDPPIDGDPITEAMLAVGLDPGISGIKEKNRANCPGPDQRLTAPPLNLSVHSVTWPSKPVDQQTEEKCFVCYKTFTLKFLEKHMFKHIREVILGILKADSGLLSWIKKYYPVVLEINVYCQSCKSTDMIFPTMKSMNNHVKKRHHNDELVPSQMFDSCFPKWSYKELIYLGFRQETKTLDNQKSVSSSKEHVKFKSLCPVCNKCRSSKFLTTHLHKHMENVFAGKEKLTRNLTLWIKENYPIALERKILCQLCGRTCYTATSVTQHVAQSHIQGVFSESNFIAKLQQQLQKTLDRCFPRWSTEELLRFGHQDDIQSVKHQNVNQTQSQPTNSPDQDTNFRLNFVNECQLKILRSRANQTYSTEVVSHQTTKSSQMPKTDVDLLDDLERWLEVKIDIDQLSLTSNPGENCSLTIEEIVDNDSSEGHAVEEIVDNDSSSEKNGDSSLCNDNHSSAVDKHFIASNDNVVTQPSSSNPLCLVKSIETINGHNISEPIDFHYSLPSLGPCTTSISTFSCAEQSKFNTIVISPTLADFAVDRCLKSDHHLTFLLKADKIEADMAKLSFPKKANCPL